MRSQFVPAARADHFHSIDLRERERTMQHAGAAAKVYMIDHPGKYALSTTASLPSWHHWWRVTAARVRLAARTDDALVKWWQTRLDAAMAAGYRNGA